MHLSIQSVTLCGGLVRCEAISSGLSLGSSVWTISSLLGGVTASPKARRLHLSVPPSASSPKQPANKRRRCVTSLKRKLGFVCCVLEISARACCCCAELTAGRPRKPPLPRPGYTKGGWTIAVNHLPRHQLDTSTEQGPLPVVCDADVCSRSFSHARGQVFWGLLRCNQD